MKTGIRLDNCEDITLEGNTFHNVKNPVVAKNTKGLKANNNVATYDEGQFRIKPLVAAIRRIIYVR